MKYAKIKIDITNVGKYVQSVGTVTYCQWECRLMQLRVCGAASQYLVSCRSQEYALKTL